MISSRQSSGVRGNNNQSCQVAQPVFLFSMAYLLLPIRLDYWIDAYFLLSVLAEDQQDDRSSVHMHIPIHDMRFPIGHFAIGLNCPAPTYLPRARAGSDGR